MLVGGAAITVEEWRENVGAILLAFYPGEQGGAALARILLGRASPGGRLPFTVPRDASQLPPFDNRALTVEYGPYHGYTLAEKRGWEPRYAFGHGLSYTSFTYANVALDAQEVRRDATVLASVDVTNAGARAGEEVVQLYVGFPESRVDRPVKLLLGFERVVLSAGETRRVTIPVAVQDLAWYDPEVEAWSVEAARHTVYVGPSSRPDSLLTVAFRVVE